MRWLPGLIVLSQITGSAAPTLPLRHFEAKIIPLAMTQDREGLLWIATPGALLRFDGLHFDPIPAPDGIDLSHVTHLASTPDGSIWIGGENGLLEYHEGRFLKRIAGPILALAVTPAGRVMAALPPGDHIFVFLPTESDRSRYLRLAVPKVNGNFTQSADGTIWFGCGVQICAWSDADLDAAAAGKRWAELHRLYFASLAYAGKAFDWSNIVATPDGNIWGTHNIEMLELERRQNYVRIINRSERPSQTFAGIRPAFLLDRRGRLWLPNRKLEVVSSGSLRLFPNDEQPFQDVTCAFQDRQGTLWFGIAGKGLLAMPDESILETYSGEEGIPGSVLDLVRHSRLGLVAATDSGVYSFDENRKRWGRAGPAADRVGLRCITSGPQGMLLTAPYRGGVLLSDPPFVTARQAHLPAGFVADRVRRLFVDRQGGAWMGVLEGLYRLDASEHLAPVPLPRGGRHVADILDGPAGDLWVGYEGGVARCTASGCAQVIGPESGMLDIKVRTVAPAGDEIWVCYRASVGFSRFSRRGGGWVATHFRAEQGYRPADTNFLRRDSRGWIWRGTDEGLYVSDGRHTAPEDWLRFTFGDRPNSTNTNIYPFREEADGSVWIGTQAGIVHLHPRAEWFAPAAPRIARLSQPATEFHLSYPGMPPCLLPQFRYRLFPGSVEWRINTSGTIRFPDLRSGTYRLEVASGRDKAPIQHTFRQRTDGGMGDRWIWIAAVVGLTVAIAPALARKLRRSRRAGEAVSYWEGKRRFLQEMQPDPGEALCEDLCGERLDGRYLLQSRLASGGFADVYRAVDLQDDETVAVKLLHPFLNHTEWRRRRFQQEVAALEKLRHPGIVRIRRAGAGAAERPYLVMELLEGITLRELIAGGVPEPARAANLLGQIGEALGAAHQAAVLHRDLKPENIIILDAGSPGERIKLIDFGIARAEAGQSTVRSTQLAGSPGYVAPERWAGRESYASDIYSFAAVAAEMLTGSPALDPSAASLPGELLDRLATGLAYDPEKRPADSAAFARELSRQLLAWAG